MRKPSFSTVLYWLMLWFTAAAPAFDSGQLLPPDEAFELDVSVSQPDKLRLTWDIADGYYLYRQKFKFVSLNPDTKVGEPIFPNGQTKNDDHFGTVEVYRNSLDVGLPIQRQIAKQQTLNLEVTFQGCADVGVCYLPIEKVISVELPDAGNTGSQP